MKNFLTLFSLFSGFCLAQHYKTLVGPTNSFDATAFNNSHKIAVKFAAKSINDSIHVVYYSSDSLFYVLSTDEGSHWQAPVYLAKGAHLRVEENQLKNSLAFSVYPNPCKSHLVIKFEILNKFQITNYKSTMRLADW